jgi:ABC-2 type transport system permease protein
MLLLYTYGVSFDIDHVKSAVLDFSRSPSTRSIIQKFNSSGYLDVIYDVNSYNDIQELLIKSEIILAFVFPPDFEENIQKGRPASVQVIANGSDANTASVALGYQAAILASYGANLAQQNQDAAGIAKISLPGVNESTRLWYNAELKSTNFIAPGVIAVVSMLLGALLTATSLVREKESGTIEMLISTPINSLELIAGKMTPYVIISFIDIVIVILVAHFGLDVPIRGSILLLLFASLLYLICALSLGLLASAITATVSASQFIVVFTSLLPSILLSGFIFPIESMPRVVQLITYVVPARYFIIIMRGIFLKGIGIEILWPQFLFLAVFGTLIMTLSASKFKKRID